MAKRPWVNGSRYVAVRTRSSSKWMAEPVRDEPDSGARTLGGQVLRRCRGLAIRGLSRPLGIDELPIACYCRSPTGAGRMLSGFATIALCGNRRKVAICWRARSGRHAHRRQRRPAPRSVSMWVARRGARDAGGRQRQAPACAAPRPGSRRARSRPAPMPSSAGLSAHSSTSGDGEREQRPRRRGQRRRRRRR